jgi:hypothetical protein
MARGSLCWVLIGALFMWACSSDVDDIQWEISDESNIIQYDPGPTCSITLTEKPGRATSG